MVQVPRRHFLRAFGALLAAPLPLLAQSGKKYRIGVVDNTIPVADLSGPNPRDPNARALVERLRELGWIEGKNIEILWRSAEENYERRPQLLKDLVRLPVDVLLVYGNQATQEALQATRSIPIVMVSSANPVRDKLVVSLARPGGNVTGMDMFADVTIAGKRLALLKQAAPTVTRVAFPTANYDSRREFAPETLQAAEMMGLTLVRVFFEGPASFGKAFADAVHQGTNGLYFRSYSAIVAPKNQAAIRALVERHRLPAIHTTVDYTDAGAILNYGPDVRASHQRAAFYVDRILRGTKPSELPIEQPTTFILVVNTRAARAIGLTIPPSVLAQADRVIE